MKTSNEEILLRGKNKGLVGIDISKIPLVTQEDGVVLTVDDLGAVRDEFEDISAINRIDGLPGLVISIDRTKSEDLLQLVDEVKSFVESNSMPAGYSLKTWGDRSVDVRDRMNLLMKNGFQGLLLVFLMLVLFLDLRLSFWVAMGIPIAVLGAGAILLIGGKTLNMLTMFAFLMALGIVVDDAIVIGENIFSHRQLNKSGVQAAIDGTAEVIPSVTASVCTTIIAFMPLFFVSGVMGKFIAEMPLAVIAMLAISLVESTLILPCHLAHTGESSVVSRAVDRYAQSSVLAVIGHFVGVDRRRCRLRAAGHALATLLGSAGSGSRRESDRAPSTADRTVGGIRFDPTAVPARLAGQNRPLAQRYRECAIGKICGVGLPPHAEICHSLSLLCNSPGDVAGFDVLRFGSLGNHALYRLPRNRR